VSAARDVSILVAGRRIFLVAVLGMLTGCSKTIPAKVRLEVQIPPDEVSTLHEVLTRFARTEGFRIYDVGAVLPPIREQGGRKVSYFDLDRADTIHIMVTNFLKVDMFLIAISEEKPSPDFDRIAAKLEAMLREQWPNIGPYTKL
jgi:hypothetical protein